MVNKKNKNSLENSLRENISFLIQRPLFQLYYFAGLNILKDWTNKFLRWNKSILDRQQDKFELTHSAMELLISIYKKIGSYLSGFSGKTSLKCALTKIRFLDSS